MEKGVRDGDVDHDNVDNDDNCGGEGGVGVGEGGEKGVVMGW